MRQSGKSGRTVFPEGPGMKYFRLFGLSEASLEASWGGGGGIVAGPSDRNPRETQGSKRQMFFPAYQKSNDELQQQQQQSPEVFLMIHALGRLKCERGKVWIPKASVSHWRQKGSP